MIPEDKLFKIYRSPATIANASQAMLNVPITDNHVDPDLNNNEFESIGKVTSSELIDLIKEDVNSKLAVKNKLEVVDKISTILESGKNQLSLGYNAELVKHDVYDFEQRNIIPHHLAIVENARGGEDLRFLDKKESYMKLKQKFLDFKKKFKDAEEEDTINTNEESSIDESDDSNATLETIVALSSRLPDALRKIPLDKLQDLIPMIQDIINMADDNTNMESDPVENIEAPQEVITDGDTKEDEVEPKKITDSGKFNDLRINSAKFNDAIERQIMLHNSVIDKAKYYLDSSYNFSGKTTKKIMYDAIATQSKERFSDSELAIAFKMLSNPGRDKYNNFGDSSNRNNGFLSLINKGAK